MTAKRALPKVSRAATKRDRPTKTVFVIMPFNESPSRNTNQLIFFYQEHIKKPIESGRFSCRYVVRRSDQSFNINDQIIKDLYAADIVVGDLSGLIPNPNVMYELGMRLAFSNGPVILIREQHKDNRSVFDVAGFYAEPYDPLNPTNVGEYLRTKIRHFESGQEVYRSPVLTVLGQEFPLLTQLSRRRAAELLDVLDDSIRGTLRLFAGAATAFVRDHKGPILGEVATKFLSEIKEHQDALQKLDWGKFVFRPGSQPAIDFYIASPYLHGLIDEAIERAFTSAVIEYHAHFLAGDVFWKHLTLNQVFVFTGETMLLSVLSLVLVKMLCTTDPTMINKTSQDFIR